MDPRYELLTSPVFLVVAGLCAARITHLVTTDSVFDHPRRWASYWDWSKELVHCPWCIGLHLSWITAALLPLVWHIAFFRVAVVGLAINYAFAYLESRE